MLDPKFIKENLDYVKKKMEERGVHIDFEKFTALDEERRRMIREVEELEHLRNTGSKKVGELKRQGKKRRSREVTNRAKEIFRKCQRAQREKNRNRE